MLISERYRDNIQAQRASFPKQPFRKNPNTNSDLALLRYILCNHGKATTTYCASKSHRLLGILAEANSSGISNIIPFMEIP